MPYFPPVFLYFFNSHVSSAGLRKLLGHTLQAAFVLSLKCHYLVPHASVDWKNLSTVLRLA